MILRRRNSPLYKKVPDLRPSKSSARKATAALPCLLLMLTACSGTPPIQPMPSASTSTNSKVLFVNAQSKRSLNLSNLASLTASGNTTGSNASPPTTVVGGAASSPIAPMPSDSLGRPQTSMPYYYGGSEFNQYQPVMAEENIFPGNSSDNLTDIYRQSVLPLLTEWDPRARLLESRGSIHPELKDPNSYEYLYVPGLTLDSPLKLRPDWIFRFASSPRKETLTIYITAKEIRVYRIVWSEPTIEILKVKITIAQAEAIARKALLDTTSNQSTYPVYPQVNASLGTNTEIVYALPANVNWLVSLSQQGEQLSYYLSANYVEAYGKPGILVVPPLTNNQEGTTGGTTSSGSGTTVPAMPPTATDMPLPASSPVSMPPTQGCQIIYQPYIYLNASVMIDAISGKVLSVNRPIRYSSYMGSDCPKPES